MAGLTDSPFGNCRIYYELYDGIRTDDVIRGLKMKLQIGGSAANIYYDQFQLSLYGREYRVDSPNVVTLHRQLVTRPANVDWVTVNLDEAIDPDLHVRTLVLKLECTQVNSIVQLPPTSKLWQDQWYAADPAPWQLRLRSYTVFASEVGRRITPRRAIKDIVAHDFPTVVGGSSGPVLDQLCFKDPGSRLEALDAVNEMEGYDYFVWDDADELVLQDQDSGPLVQVHSHDPAISYDFTENIDDTYNACRVGWIDHQGEPHEVIVFSRAPGLGAWGRVPGNIKAFTFQAPDSCKNAKSVLRVARRFLRDHRLNSVDGSLTVTGVSADLGDALLLRPGPRYTIAGAANVRHRMKATRVTLHPLEWTAQVSFELSPRRFDQWLARLDAGAKARRR
jgi:hypothetical protein